MPAFQNERRAAGRLAPVILLGWLASLPATLAAQPVGPPIPLIPQSSPTSRLPSLPSVTGRDEAVASEPLAPPGAAWNSIVPAPQDALPESVWRGTSSTMAELLLARLPDTTSPALQSLERRLLLSPAAGPEGEDAASHRLPALRAAALLRLGELDAARAVVAAIPERQRDWAAPLAVAADAIGGNVERACTTVRETMRRNQDPFWQTALIACQALQGEIGQAQLGLKLLAEEQQTAGDETLAKAVATLAGRPVPMPVGGGSGLDPLTLRLLAAAWPELKPGLIDTLRPDLALYLALDDDAPAEARLLAAERAARFGAVSPDRLRSWYSAMAAAAGGGDTAALSRARHFSQIGAAGDDVEKIAQIGRFADALAASGWGGFGLAARLVAPALREIEPATPLADSAASAARLLIAAGDIRRARGWTALVSGDERHSLDLLISLAAPADEPVLDRTEAPVPVWYPMLASALGEVLRASDWAALPPTAWSATKSPSQSPAAAAWLGLAEAAHGKRIGEAILAAIMVAAPAGVLATDPVALYEAVSALKQVGLAVDARRLAVEGALATGL